MYELENGEKQMHSSPVFSVSSYTFSHLICEGVRRLLYIRENTADYYRLDSPVWALLNWTAAVSFKCEKEIGERKREGTQLDAAKNEGGHRYQI